VATLIYCTKYRTILIDKDENRYEVVRNKFFVEEKITSQKELESLFPDYKDWVSLKSTSPVVHVETKQGV
jgi:hypothetical protein